MNAIGDNLGSRLRYTRQRWGLTQDELASKAGVGVATIRRMEAGTFDPRLSTARKLAEALLVYVEWLIGSDMPMVPLWHMTVEEQHARQNGPEQAGLPGYVVIDPGGPWYQDESGEWRISTRQNDDWSVTHS